MTSSNLNKIMQSNINFKPWMLSKNTRQIVDTYIQKMYREMPKSFRKEIRTCKVAAPKPENKGPLRAFKSQERQVPVATITPRAMPKKKSNLKLKQQNNNLMNSLKISNKNNQQLSYKYSGANTTLNKTLQKSPNYKIYKSRRFGSSASSSRSSLFKRYDERRRLRQVYPAQINYLIRSFHTSQFEPTYARYLMPARNQQLGGNLGSIPDAIKFSLNIQNDLMKIDNSTGNPIANIARKKSTAKLAERNRLDTWNHPPSLSKFKIKSPRESAIKQVSSPAERNMRRIKLSPEHRDYARINLVRANELKHPKPANELFTAQHDRNNTELHEKHRRNRMKKLGLIRSPTTASTATEDGGAAAKATLKDSGKQLESVENQFRKEVKRSFKSIPTLSNQTDNKSFEKLLTNKNLTKKIDGTKENNPTIPVPVKKETTKPVLAKQNIPNNPFPVRKETTKPVLAKQNIPNKPVSVKTTETTKPVLANCIPIKTNGSPTSSTDSKDLGSFSSAALPKCYTTISPIVAARAQMVNRNTLRSYRYNRADFFSTKKY